MSGDNGQPEAAPKIIPIVVVGLIEGKQELMVQGQLGNKQLCLNALADAIKVIANMQEQPKSNIIVPKVDVGIKPRF